jgi:UDP:flavonoid glycosyltransferase YjiC (YdhE family)
LAACMAARMRVLICPLDWGLGHAGRCITLIRALLGAGHAVRFAAAGGALRLLRSEFPELPWHELAGYRVRYSRSAALLLPSLLAQAPAFLLGLRSERRRLRRLLAEHPCDLVISDGRYGLYAPGVPAILVTHQIALRAPDWPGRTRAERLLLRLNLKALARFDRVWIPDLPGVLSLAGELAGPEDPASNREWIGPLGRFAPPAAMASTVGRTRIDIAAVVSGPEPQRSLFEADLRAALAGLAGTRILVRGRPGKAGPGLADLRPGELNVFDHLPGGELAQVFAGAEALVARSGYTTVMELAVLGAAAAVLVPTPGQTEQEYLADHLAGLGAAVKLDQGKLDLASAIDRARRLPGFRRWREADPAERLGRLLASHPLLAGRDRAMVGKTAEQ